MNNAPDTDRDYSPARADAERPVLVADTAQIADLESDMSNFPICNWEDEVGNDEAKEAALAIIRQGGRMFLAGPSGSGKTLTIMHACQFGACSNPQGTEPCGKCRRCKNFKARDFDIGLHETTRLSSCDCAVHLVHFNCRQATATRLYDQLDTIRHEDGLRIVYLDEASNLRRLQCDEVIKDLMDDPYFRTCRWFASSVTDEDIDEQLRRRFTVKVSTASGSIADVARCLARRCVRLRLKVADARLLLKLASRCWGIVGLAMCVLDMACKSTSRELTTELVEKYPFPKRSPWRARAFAT